MPGWVVPVIGGAVALVVMVLLFALIDEGE